MTFDARTCSQRGYRCIV